MSVMAMEVWRSRARSRSSYSGRERYHARNMRVISQSPIRSRPHSRDLAAWIEYDLASSNLNRLRGLEVEDAQRALIIARRKAIQGL